MRFYYGRKGNYPLRASAKENGLFWDVFLPVFGLSGGPPQSEMGTMVFLDTEKGVNIIESFHTRFYYWREGNYPLRASTGKWGVLGCVSARFWAVRVSPTVQDWWYGGPRHRHHRDIA